ncbi:hypothetical protein AUJ84_03160 [Candidatus Pacearchaeota archaeon CG1_02_32_132]|nr:MAG: hypothetical protein AUJ84_03160 [Candidatus Pacearchaeota archaeon CG1_02_32_132]
MKLDKKKALAVRTFGVGKSRIVFNNSRLDEIKEAITKQDIKDLVLNGAISIKEIKGRKTKKVKKTRRRKGSIKRTVNTRKRDYMTLTRKFRSYVTKLKKNGLISRENYIELRKQIRLKAFKSLAHIKEKIREMRKEEDA